MNSQYVHPNVYDAPSPGSISPPESVCASSADFMFADDIPSPEFNSELDMLHSQTLDAHRAEARANASSSHIGSSMQDIRHQHDAPFSPSDDSNPSSDFQFMNSLLSIRGTRDQDGGDHGGVGVDGPTESEVAVAETIVRARKSWKTVKGRSEPVWPPHLEKALVQALLQYKPHDSRYARALGRFPKRNRYISDYIFEATGVRRTPKQVGSRLQQLKDVSCGKMLLNHVASWALQSSPKPSTGNDAAASSTSLHPDLSVIINGMHGYGSDSPSPVSPLAGGGAGSREASLPAGAAMGPYHTQPSLHPAARGAPASVPKWLFDSPPVTPTVRKMDVFVPFNPSNICEGKSKYENGNENGRPLVRFAGCLARPETVNAPQPVDAGQTSGRLDSCVTFSSRDPIGARSVARVWVDNRPFSSSMSSMSDSSHLTTSADMRTRVKIEDSTLAQVHQHVDALVCTQTPAARASAAQTSFYSTDNVILKKEGEDGCERFVYATHLVDDAVWSAMRREGVGLRRYTIIQELMHSFDSPTTRRGEAFLVITYHFVPISNSTDSMHPPSHSMLSSLDTRGQGLLRGSVSPASSGTPSPISASPSSFVQSQSWQSYHNASNHGNGQNAYRETHSAQVYSHSHSQARLPQVSVQAPTPTISQTGVLMHPFVQEECYNAYNADVGPGTFSTYDAGFGGLNMENMQLTTSPTVATSFDNSYPFC
ncbi:hypothetical protein ACEPAH_7167 [Sanghuangporus vaninii]